MATVSININLVSEVNNISFVTDKILKGFDKGMYTGVTMN